ncbi:MAG: hypothetical protein JWN49_322 [Parcubacteria group bacterium]|nr:hypothetical protein [Parcubacteria group bacterium]
MTILNRSLSVVLGATIALTPVFAFAHDEDASTTTKTPFISSLLNRIENIRGPEARGDVHTSAQVEASTTSSGFIHKGEQGSKGGNGVSDSVHAGAGVRADASIDARMNALQKLSDRIDGAKRLSDGMKTSLSATLAAQIQELTDLKAKIGNDTSTSSMRDDAGKIRPEFRTYALVLPKTAITAGSDRVLTIATQMDIIGAKLNTRINEAAASSTVNVSAAQTAYADYIAKVADAKVQANAAAALVVNLAPDNGDKTIFASNSAALKSAAAKLKVAQQDLKAARADIGTILKVIKGTSVKAHGEASSTVEVK